MSEATTVYVKKNKKNSDIEAGYLKIKDDEKELSFEKKNYIEFDSITNEIAQSSIFYRRHKLDELKEAFSYNVKMQVVDKFYPFSQYGELYIDEPRTEKEIEASEKKKEVLKNKLFFILYPNRDINLHRDELERCFRQFKKQEKN